MDDSRIRLDGTKGPLTLPETPRDERVVDGLTQTFGPPENKISVLNDDTNLTVTVANNALESVTMNVHAHYDRSGEPFEGAGLLIDARLQNATYNASDSSISGSGSLTLRENATIRAGDRASTWASRVILSCLMVDSP